MKKARSEKILTYAERKKRREEAEKKFGSSEAAVKASRDQLMLQCEDIATVHGKTKEYWYTRIMQSARLEGSQRKISRWNVFQSMKVRQWNSGK